jgi:hypothetical protein
MNNIRYDKTDNLGHTILITYPSGVISNDNHLSLRVYLDVPDHNPGMFGSPIISRT